VVQTSEALSLEDSLLSLIMVPFGLQNGETEACSLFAVRGSPIRALISELRRPIRFPRSERLR